MSDYDSHEYDQANDIAKAKELYAAGKPVFTRAMLEYFNERLESGQSYTKLLDYLDRECESANEMPDYLCSRGDNIRMSIMYNSIESLVRPMPEGICLYEMRPMMLAYTRDSKYSRYSLDELADLYVQQRKAWETSETRRFLVQQLDKFTPGQIAGITKVVGFALGDVAMSKKKEDVQRPLAQHASLLTIAGFLTGRNGGREVPCYSQDPANNAGPGTEFLRTIGITPLDDPKGFLAVDENTLVVSVAPNVPVRQILADIQWPLAMLWNTVETSEKRKWVQTEIEEGKMVWKSPHSTDPDSSRVVNMVEHYDPFPFVDSDGWFGDMTLYVRKDS